MAVVDHIADLADIVDLAKTFKANFDGTYSSILSSQIAGSSVDADGRLNFLAKDVRFGSRRHFARLAGNIREMAVEVLRSLARTLNRADVGEDSPPERILGVGLRQWMIDNSKKLKSRGVTHNAASAFTGTGTGLLYVHTTDDQGTPDNLEAVTDGVITFKCTADSGMGRESGSELFEVRDEAPARDILELGGFGKTTMEAFHSGKVSAVSNADFDQAFGSDSASTTKIPGYTIATGTPGNLTQDSTNLFRGRKTVSAAGNFKLVQSYSGLPNNVPTQVNLAWNREIGSIGAGNLTIRIGGKSATVAIAAQTGWQRLNLVAWPKAYSGSGNDIEIELDSYASGALKFGQLNVAPMRRLGGRYFQILAGDTDFAVGDYASQDTSIAATGLIKDWLHRWFGLGFELPHNASPSAGWEDPT
jgi:hypothetical protein